MATEYRIVMQGQSFFVQKKRLWWWTSVREVTHFNSHGPSLTSIVRFATVEQAREWIEDLRPKKASEMMVIESRIIL